MPLPMRALARERLLLFAASRARQHGQTDALVQPLTAAGLACVPSAQMLEGVAQEMERLLPQSATPLERGIMMGAAITLALLTPDDA